MVRNMTGLLLVGIGLGLLGPNAAPAESLDVVATIAVDWLDEGQLVYRSSASLQDEVGYLSGQFLSAVRKPASLRAEPTYGSSKRQYFVWSMKDGPRVLVLDESRGSGRGYDRLFVDQNGDGIIAEGEQVRGWRRQGNLVFGPVGVLIPTANGPRLYHFLARVYSYAPPARYLNVESAGYYLGQLRLGKQSHKVALVDNNANGVFNDLSTSPWDGDRLLIDLDGDGKFVIGGPDGRETFPLGKLLQVQDRYLALEVAPDGSRLAVSEPELKLGQVRSETGAFQIMLSSPAGALRVKSDDGRAQVPVGEYRLSLTSITQTDDQGRRWELRSYARGGEGAEVKVPEGETTRLELGAPLEAKVTSRVDGRNVNFSLQLTDAAGLPVSNLSVNGQRPAAPKLRIAQADGKEVGLYDFHYG